MKLFCWHRIEPYTQVLLLVMKGCILFFRCHDFKKETVLYETANRFGQLFRGQVR